MPEGVYAKDVILEIIRKLTVSGATDRVIEFVGEIVDSMSMEERMTLSNMAVEAGATSGICLPDAETVDYLWPHIKDEFADKSEAIEKYGYWRSDEDAQYESSLQIDVSELEPLVTVGYKPDEVRKVSELADTKIDQVYIGSCTNGRISDFREAARITKGKKLADNVRGIICPATPRVYRQAMEEGLLEIFMEAGYCITNPTCGACLGMSNGVLAQGEVCAATTNRNFNGRMGAGGMVHLMSPATAAASGIAGKIADPRKA
jgi:3-isopropylmalate/(R)-2-methylmalate dehydratase large subunit